MTDNGLRRAASSMRYRGKQLPLKIADVLVHDLRPGESTLLQYPGETRRQAADRLREWLQPK